MAPFTKSIKAGMHLFRENDRSRELYLIQSGSVKVYRTAGGKEVELAVLEKGAVLGEMALIDGKSRSASVKAITACSVIIIDAETFHNKIKGIPPWFISIIKSTSQKIRQANRRLQNISSEHQGAHIIMLLCLYLQRFGRDPQGIPLRKIQHHLIQMLGVTYQIVIDTLDFLCKNHFIAINDNKLFPDNSEKFCEYCDYLRFFLRKQFDNLDHSDTRLEQLAPLLVAKFGSTLLQDSGATTLEGGHFYEVLQSCNLDTHYLDLIDMLDTKGFTTVTRKTRAKSTIPLGDCTIKLHHLAWKRAFLFYQYNKYSLGTL